MEASCNLLVFEPECGGHRGDYVRALLAELGRRENAGGVRFVLGHRLVRQDGGIAAAIRSAPKGVEIVEIPEGSTRKEWLLLLRQAISDARPERVLLFELTPWENGLSRHPLGVPISGILFVQYPELDWRHGPQRRRLERWIRFQIKEWKTARWLKCQDWRSVFLFNGERACEYLNRRFSDFPVFKPLPDPAPELSDVVFRPCRTRPGPEEAAHARVKFEFPGVLSFRKGADILLKALLGISPAVTGRAEFCCSGMAEARDRPAIERMVRRLRRARPDVRFEWDDRFLPEAELQMKIQRADWILAPYRRTEYSSGIFGRAAAAGTPMIGPADGLLGRLIREWGLGMTVETTPRAWAKALENAVGSPMTMDESRRWAFLRRSRAEDFARQLLGG